MTIQAQVQELIDATEPLWNKVMHESILVSVPEAEKNIVLDILVAMRVKDLTMALKLAATKNISMKARRKYIHKLQHDTNVITAVIANQLT